MKYFFTLLKYILIENPKDGSARIRFFILKNSTMSLFFLFAVDITKIVINLITDYFQISEKDILNL